MDASHGTARVGSEDVDAGGDTAANNPTDPVTPLRQVLVYPGEDGYWVAECPSLPGCITQGATRAEAILNIREAIALYVEVLEERGVPVPVDHLEAILVAV